LVPFRVSSYRYKGENVILVKLPLLASEEKIRSVMESNVFISPEEIEESPPEFKSLDTFTGYSVKNTKTGFIGTITGIQDISGNPLFIIENPRGEILVPVAEELIVAINDSTKEIEMEISDGLLDINLP
jgi:16S rRNA processing protein RimM